MDIRVENKESLTICHLSGDIDNSDTESLVKILAPFLANRETPLEIDFQQLNLTANGLKALLCMAYSLYVTAGSYRLTGLKENALSLLNMSGLHKLIGGSETTLA